MQIGLLNNLRAGRSHTRSNEHISRMMRLLSAHPEVAHVETESEQALPEALSELSRREVDVLVVNGGDGTLQHALTEILSGGEFSERVPLIAPLRGGSTNMTALDLGAHRDPVRGLANVIEANRNGTLEERILRREVLRVEHGRQHEALYGMFFGVGMIHRAIELTLRLFPRGRSSVASSTLVTANLVARAALLKDTDGVLSPDKVQMLIDGEEMHGGEYTLLISSSLHRLFSRMRPFWGDGPGGVRFTSIETAAQHLWRNAPGILAGRPGRLVTEENGYRSRNARRLDLKMDCGFTVDGELREPEEGRNVSVTAEHSVRFVRA